MAINTSLFTSPYPGVFVTEGTYGAKPATLASFATVYVLGSSSQVGAPEDVATYISSVDDFANVFGASPSAAAIQLYFDQRPGTGLWFINVGKRTERSLAVTAATVGVVSTLTVDGYAISYTAVAGDTVSTIRAKLGNLVNTQIPHSASYYPDGTLRYKVGLTVVGTANLTLGTATTATAPTAKDVADTIKVAFEPEMSQGYVCAPEFFQAFTSASDHTFLALELEALASNLEYSWVALVDCSEMVATTTTGGGAINAALAERSALASPLGHSWYYFPYFLNSTETLVPPSLAVAGVALRRARNGNFAEPPAGTSYPVYGIKGVSFKVTNSIQGQLNPVGINCVRKLPAGQGTVIYGARTLSTNSFYTFGATRVILNVLEGSLRTALASLVFSLVDGTGILFSVVKQTASLICERLRLAGALYGATADQAYLVVCDATNNDPGALDSGVVGLDVVVKPSPVLEVLHINVSRAATGTVLAEIVAAGDNSAVKSEGSETT